MGGELKDDFWDKMEALSDTFGLNKKTLNNVLTEG